MTKKCFLGANEDALTSSIPWFLIGIAGGLGLYWLLKPKAKTSVPGVTQAAPVAPLTSPERFVDLDSVDARFGQVRELYRMGYLNAEAALAELATLVAAARSMSEQDAEKAGSILARIDVYAKEVGAYAQGTSIAMQGRRFRVVN